MTPIEKLVERIRRAVNAGPGAHVYANAKEALEEYESAPRPWTPPWPIKIPDWARWVTCDKDGTGKAHRMEPSGCGRRVWFRNDNSETEDAVVICKFEIPPGADWRTMKVRVR